MRASAQAVIVVIGFVFLCISIVLAVSTNNFLNPMYLAVLSAAFIYVVGAFFALFGK